MKPHPLRAGLFGIGLEAYWPQFDGLKPKLKGYLGQAAQKLGPLLSMGVVRVG
jgi:L-arabinose isomerase